MFWLASVTRLAEAVLFVGSGGCDVSDTGCAQPSPPFSHQILALSPSGSVLQNTTTEGSPSWVHVGGMSPHDRLQKCVFAALSDVDKVASFALDAATGLLSPAVSVVHSGGASPAQLEPTSPPDYPRTSRAAPLHERCLHTRKKSQDPASAVSSRAACLCHMLWAGQASRR